MQLGKRWNNEYRCREERIGEVSGKVKSLGRSVEKDKGKS